MHLPPFRKGIHLDSLKLQEDDEKTLPKSSTVAVPLPYEDVEARQVYVG